ncbi:MAG TPA: flagellar motor protein MotB [Leptospiraceae bacterium]|nr:flagellar motor protein MotB [Leptospiraceae bacterium]HMY68425.1 flagellar motor protein MotB [Leptospiraceae bacterium]HMZ58975.1 flagellar motor protein MotB [Leptospiraceae bacterium]HNF17248.1 flagellar motor protein MotB [Leptospiraceae bacterium]HNF26626.1 flagellar motor protein MotB [Leptospiraceae bacterium]
MAKQRCPECIQKVPEYMLTYGDMVTLLLCFFVMLYTTGKTNQREMQIILSVFKSSTGFFDGGQTLSKGSLEQMGMNVESLPSQTRGRASSKAIKAAHQVFKSEMQQGKVRVSEDERGLVISLMGADYFNPASAILLPPIKDVLKKAAPFIKEMDRYVRVEGHSDHDAVLPGTNEGKEERNYINNWDLAAARAVNTTTYLVNVGQLDPEILQAVSYGSARPFAVEMDSNIPEAKAYNRRIDLVLLSEKSVKRKISESNYKLPKSKLPGTENTLEGEN